MNTKSELLQTLITLSVMRRTKIIDRGQVLPPASPSPMLKTTVMNAETEIHLQEAWEMMP